MAASCSRWWHAPIYVTLSTALAIIVITSFATSPRTSPDDDTLIIFSNQTTTATHDLCLNASNALRSHGFTFTSFLLQLSPDFFFSPFSPPTTVFALQDSAIANISLPPWAMKRLLQYHITTASNFTFQSLLQIPPNTCLPTSVPGKSISITSVDPKNGIVEINHVGLTHPDLFLGGSISIHGVLGPFTVLDTQEIKNGVDFIHPPDCSVHHLPQLAPDTNPESSPHRPIPDTATTPPPDKRPGWKQIIQILSSNGFISFAIGLNSVLDDILTENPRLDSGTIFAPQELGSVVGSPGPLQGRVVRYHLLPERYRFSDLASLPEKARLRTLLKEKDLEVTTSFNSSQLMAIEGANILVPEIFSTKAFIVHVISRAFYVGDSANAYLTDHPPVNLPTALLF